MKDTANLENTYDVEAGPPAGRSSPNTQTTPTPQFKPGLPLFSSRLLLRKIMGSNSSNSFHMMDDFLGTALMDKYYCRRLDAGFGRCMVSLPWVRKDSLLIFPSEA
jgi:hypothetical protein